MFTQKVCFVKIKSNTANGQKAGKIQFESTSERKSKMIKKDEIMNYIEKGPHGITKHQMIPAIDTYHDNRDVVIALYKNFPDTFASSLRYVKKASRMAVRDILGDDVSKCSPDKLALIEELEPKRKGVSMHQIINGVEGAVDAGDFEKVARIQKHFPEFYKRAKRYIKKPTLEKIRAFTVVAKKAVQVQNNLQPAEA